MDKPASKNKLTVTFLPDEKTVLVDCGKSILEASILAGIPINANCGGKGVCGQCKVIVKSGEVDAEPTFNLTSEEIKQGYVLACKCHVVGDMVVEVPAKARFDDMLYPRGSDDFESDSRPALVGVGKLYPHDPLVKKVYIKMPPPTLQDSLSDMERLFRELRKECGLTQFQIDLEQLRQLPKLLREQDWKVTAMLSQCGSAADIIQIQSGDTSGSNYGVAVDVGTTTIVAYLVELNTCKTIAGDSKYNSQIQYGEDVISRIMFANTEEKRNQLSACVVADINNLIQRLAKTAGIAPHDLNFVMCAGNTTMIHFLLGLDPSNIRVDPYVPVAVAPPVFLAAEVGININPHGLLGCVPSVASYVGGDIVAAVLVSGMLQSESPSMLIDLGTNGEIVVGNKEWLACCSASAGPAFEGGGISCGMRATIGAIDRISMENRETVSYNVIGGGRPLGICGSGMIDAIAEMLRYGCLDRSGAFVASKNSKRIREGEEGLEFVLVDGDETATGREIVITQADVENFIRSKGAIYHAAECLLERVGMSFQDIECFYISGGFGNYLNVREAITIGLLPDIQENRFSFIGNGSVQGAKTVLLSRQAFEEAKAVASRMTYIELSTDARFMNDYTAALFLPHTDIEKFPSVVAEIGQNNQKFRLG